MNRRSLLSLFGSVGITAFAGCSTLSDFNDSDSSGTPTPTPEENPVNFRVDFVDEAGTMQHVADTYSSENESERVVNEYSEEEWQEFETMIWDSGPKGIWMSKWTTCNHLWNMRSE